MEFLNNIINSKSKIFLSCLLFFIAGVALGNFFVADSYLIFCLMLFAVFLLLMNIKRSGSVYTANVVIILLAVSLIFGFWRYQISLPDFGDPVKIYHYNGQQIKFVGKIISIDERVNLRKLTVESESLSTVIPSGITPKGGIKRDNSDVTKVISSSNRGITTSRQGGTRNDIVSGRVMINTALYPAYAPGDIINVSCKLQAPGIVADSSAAGASAGFDYGRYLSKDNIYSLCSFADLRVIKSAPLSWPLLLFITREHFSAGLSASLPEPAVGILTAMLLNISRGLDPALSNLFAKLGLTHIIAISGSHITTIAAILIVLAIGLGLKRQNAFWPVAIIIAFYTAMVGAPPSALRAAIMGIMLLYAQKIGRRNSLPVALAFAAALMVLINPKILMIDAGFQLSFMSVLGLIYLVPVLEKYFSRLPDFWQLKEIALVTLSAQIMTLPLTVLYFGRFSPLSLLANLLILPVIPLLTIWGIFHMLAAAIYLPLGQLLGLLSWLLIEYWIKAAQLLGWLPLTFNFTANAWLAPLVAYPLIGYWIWRERKKEIGNRK